VSRPPWDSFFLDLAVLWSTMSTCSRRQVGAVVVQDRKVIGNGFNGVASGKPHCTEGGCPRGQLDYAEVPARADYNAFPRYAIHAEHNAILQAGLQSCAGATLYCTDEPCQQCANLIEHAGIGRVVIVGHQRGEDQDSTEEPMEHDAPHPSTIEENE
jgi:dCMP deaminase